MNKSQSLRKILRKGGRSKRNPTAVYGANSDKEEGKPVEVIRKWCEGFPLSNQPWLTPWEQEEVIGMMLRFNLIKFSNARNLPLKKGGTTDIYVMERDERDNPEALDYLADVYSSPIRRLYPNRIAEVPSAVSGIAALVSVKTGIPRITLREQAKEGRVAKADVIGNPRFGDRVVIMDDVITDGASKEAPYQKCVSMGLKVLPQVVLVDRQQGWKKKFYDLRINSDVWPGMTLHDIRKYLITRGLMERCSKEAEEKNPIIAALDGKCWEELLPLLDRLRPSGCILKANDFMFAEGIKNLLPSLQAYGRVMVDLKCHDIPNTVENITKHLLPNPPWAVTVHASGGKEMLEAAVKTLAPTPTKVLAVTVLTSLKADKCEEIYVRKPLDQVLKLAEIANAAGVQGFVCSPQEVGELKVRYPDKEFVTPGVRSPGADPGDQARIDTPANAIAKGATKLVMGRQLLGATDPVAEVKRVMKEELGIS